jgi:hypothetical protein
VCYNHAEIFICLLTKSRTKKQKIGFAFSFLLEVSGIVVVVVCSIIEQTIVPQELNTQSFITCLMSIIVPISCGVVKY